MLCGPCSWSGLIRAFDFLGRLFWKLWSGGVLWKRMPRRNIVRDRNKRGFHLSYKIYQEPVVFAVRDEVFWTEDLIEETTKGLHDSYTILTLIQNMTCLPDWTVLYPVLSSNLRLALHMLVFGTKKQRMRVSATLKFRKKLPILIQTGDHQKQSQMDLEGEDLCWVLVRVDLTKWEIRLIYLIFMLWHYWLYISGIWRWTDSFISEY